MPLIVTVPDSSTYRLSLVNALIKPILSSLPQTSSMSFLPLKSLAEPSCLVPYARQDYKASQVEPDVPTMPVYWNTMVDDELARKLIQYLDGFHGIRLYYEGVVPAAAVAPRTGGVVVEDEKTGDGGGDMHADANANANANAEADADADADDAAEGQDGKKADDEKAHDEKADDEKADDPVDEAIVRAVEEVWNNRDAVTDKEDKTDGANPPPAPSAAGKAAQNSAASSGPAPSNWDDLEDQQDIDFLADENIRKEVNKVRQQLQQITNRAKRRRKEIVAKEVKSWYEANKDFLEKERAQAQAQSSVSPGTQPERPLAVAPQSSSNPRGINNAPAWMSNGASEGVQSLPPPSPSGNARVDGDGAGGAADDAQPPMKKPRLSEANRDLNERKGPTLQVEESQADIRERNRREDDLNRKSKKAQSEEGAKPAPELAVPTKADLEGVEGLTSMEKKDLASMKLMASESSYAGAFSTPQMKVFVEQVINEYLGETDETMVQFVVEAGGKEGTWVAKMNELWDEMETVLEEETGEMMQMIVKGAGWIAKAIEGGEGA